MTTTILSTNSIGTTAGTVSVAQGDDYIILPGVTLGHTDGRAFNVTGTLRVDGSVYASDATIYAYDGADISIGAEGRLVSTWDASASGSIFFSGMDVHFNNAGEISGETSIALRSSNIDNTIINSGSISGASGLRLGESSSHTGNSLFNSGVIAAGTYDDDVRGYSYNNAVRAVANDTVIANLSGGELVAISSEGAGVSIGTNDTASGDGSTVTNQGQITSVQFYGVDFYWMENSEAATLTNSGTISGGAGAFRGNESGEMVTNSGTMDGNVLLRQGDDTYQGRGDGVVIGEVRGGAGDDTMRGGSGTDLFDGGDGEDDLRGRAGDDIVEGGADDDIVIGNQGDDRVDGNQGNDRLFGNLGDDIVRGGSGDDLIVGGRGDDVLTGNSGEDIFVFNRRTDEDIIMDFQNNIDQLDLTAFGLSSVGQLFAAGAIVEDGSGSIIDLTAIGGDGTIYVDDMAVADWTGADFIL